MKSIKEKADEFAITNKNSLGYVMQEHVDGYIAGANYVLDKVEMLLNSQRFVDDPSQELYKLIKQLKK